MATEITLTITPGPTLTHEDISRLNAIATARGITPDELTAEIIREAIATPPTPKVPTTAAA